MLNLTLDPNSGSYRLQLRTLRNARLRYEMHLWVPHVALEIPANWHHDRLGGIVFSSTWYPIRPYENEQIRKEDWTSESDLPRGSFLVVVLHLDLEPWIKWSKSLDTSEFHQLKHLGSHARGTSLAGDTNNTNNDVSILPHLSQSDHLFSFKRVQLIPILRFWFANFVTSLSSLVDLCPLRGYLLALVSSANDPINRASGWPWWPHMYACVFLAVSYHAYNSKQFIYSNL